MTLKPIQVLQKPLKCFFNLALIIMRGNVNRGGPWYNVYILYSKLLKERIIDVNQHERPQFFTLNTNLIEGTVLLSSTSHSHSRVFNNEQN